MSWAAAGAIASIAGTALSAASTLSSAGAARGRGGANADAFTAQGNQARRTAAGLRDQANEVDTQVAMEEANRLQQYQAMMSTNIAEVGTRGITDSASTAAIMRHNTESAATDLMAVKYMGSAKAKRLRASADANEEAANAFYAGAVASIDQGNTESGARLAAGGWQLASSMPNMVKSFGDLSKAFGGGSGVTIRHVSSTPEPYSAGGSTSNS
jgi:hypothetical protein